MSFMDANRRTNGAANPTTTASQDASAQRSAKMLDPNFDIPGSSEDWRFTPSMSTPAEINSAHYQGGISGDGPYKTSYEDKIPYVSQKVVHDEGTRGLKG